MLSETEILNTLKKKGLSLPPLSLKLAKTKIPDKPIEVDAVMESDWGKEKLTFVVEVKRYSSDRTVYDAMRQCKYLAEKLSAFPLIVTAWLSEEQLELLEKEGVSGIDLSGNGVVSIPGKILVKRSGKPNLYPDSRAVKNVYEGTSSLVARIFLTKPRFSSVMEIVEEIQSLGGSITQSTVSKALMQLEEDLVIRKEKREIKLIQAEKLLERLATNTKLPRRINERAVEFQIALSQIPKAVIAKSKKARAKVVVTGTGSINEYAMMPREPLFEFYTDVNPSEILSQVEKQIDFNSRFPNLRIIQTDDPAVFFDKRMREDVPFASPLQSYLELMKGDKRDKETASWLKKEILRGIE